MKLEEIAAELGVTRERVRQIEERALRKLRCRLAKDPDLAADLEGWLVEALGRVGGCGLPRAGRG